MDFQEYRAVVPGSKNPDGAFLSLLSNKQDTHKPKQNNIMIFSPPPLFIAAFCVHFLKCGGFFFHSLLLPVFFFF